MTRLVRERFPGREDEILGLYARDPEFRGLCHDFGVCVKEIERLTESPTSTDRDKHLEQFRELKSELEVDISEHLNSTTKPSDSEYTRKDNHV